MRYRLDSGLRSLRSNGAGGGGALVAHRGSRLSIRWGYAMSAEPEWSRTPTIHIGVSRALDGRQMMASLRKPQWLDEFRAFIMQGVVNRINALTPIFPLTSTHKNLKSYVPPE
jgi:hypothetical protein